MARASLAVLFAAAVLWDASPAYAYLDPGTGSIILQALLGGIAGAAIAAKLYWSRIKSFFGGKTQAEPGLDVETDSKG